MNLYLKTEKLDDIEFVVANKEQQRLQDLLIFIEEYTNAESNISNELGSLSELSDDWYLRAAPPRGAAPRSRLLVRQDGCTP